MTVRLLIADMDSTIIENECIDELADAVGLKDQVSAITERAMRGELDFEAALRERVGMLKGLPEAALQDVYDSRIRLTKGAREMTDALHARGIKCVLVSGGFTFFTGRIADAAGFDAHHANTLNVADGKLTGTVGEPILGAEAKLETMRRYADEMGIGLQQVIAIGDGANDLPMIQAAGFGIGFCAKPKVAEAAQYRIDERDLTKVLDIAGLR
ncbi:phosphoserine phosphatase SerB [Iodidimonas sp. SYSU 1G8]|uniref:phosphoserine phosphatase SerB n=1 Tax=Iodidimonas sp. SYSU 1G8 TaxID=3133967 RepID=UPI0031FEC269